MAILESTYFFNASKSDVIFIFFSYNIFNAFYFIFNFSKMDIFSS